MKFLLIEDNEVFRRGFEAVLKDSDPAFETLHSDSCEAALKLLEHDQQIELIVLDRVLKGMPGLEGLTLLRRKHPNIPVVVLSAYIDAPAVYDALDKGAMGYIAKGVDTRIILSAIKLVLNGGLYLPAEIFTSRWFSPTTGGNQLPEAFGFTVRQAQVLAWIVKGASDKMIARKLGIEEGTVGTHVTTVYRKLDVTKRAEAIVKAFELGMDLRGYAVDVTLKSKVPAG